MIFKCLTTIILALTILLPVSYAQDSSDVSLLGGITDLWQFSGPVEIVGELTYIGTHDQIRIVDISDPPNPEIIGSFGFPDSIDIDATTVIEVFGDYLYVGFVKYPHWQPHQGFAVFDISDPAEPELTQVILIDNTHPTHINRIDDNIYVAGIYTENRHGFAVMHVFETGDRNLLAEINQHGLVGGACAEIYSVEFTDTHIITTADCNDFGLIGLATLQGELIELEAWEIESLYLKLFGNFALSISGEGELQIFDISNPTDFELVGQLDSGLSSQGDFEIFIVDESAYIFHRNGIQVINISDPRNPEIISEYIDQLTDIRFVDLSGEIACLKAWQNGPLFFDISDPEEILLVGEFDNDFYQLRSPYYHNNMLFVNDENCGIRVYDVSDPGQIQLISIFEGENWGTSQMHAIDTIMYVNPSSHDDLLILNIARPDSIYIIGTYEEEGREVRGLSIQNNLAYVQVEWEIVVLDISVPGQPEFVSRTPINGGGLQISGDYGYLSYFSEQEKYICIIDVSDVQNIFEVDSLDIPGIGSFKVGNGLLLFQNWRQDEILIYDLDDPVHPELISTQDSYQAFDVEDDFLFTTYDESLRVVNISNPSRPIETGFYNPGMMAHLVVNDNIIFGVSSNSIVTFDCERALSAPIQKLPIVSDMSLLEAFPNPFNSTIIIKYAVTLIMPVRLDIYDVNGRLVSNLVNGMQNVGIHAATVYADGWGSGLYFVRLDAGGEVFTRKVMLVR